MNFPIKSHEIISQAFLNNNIQDFKAACEFVSALPYKRDADKNNLLCIFEDKVGTCSTKHAVLRKLALENNKSEVKLILGIFKMDAEYSAKIAHTLKKYQLDYIPEAHNYLKINHEYFDFTIPNASYENVKLSYLKK